MAEKKWMGEQTERIVKECEVLDREGEMTVLSSGKKKKKQGLSQRAVKIEAVVPRNTVLEENDRFELI
jgi:hypothetical protein